MHKPNRFAKTIDYLSSKTIIVLTVSLALAAGIFCGCGKETTGQAGGDGTGDGGGAEIPGQAGDDEKVTEISTLKVMSFNILRGDLQGPDHLWTVRREACLAMIAAQQPMVFGLQECTWTQRRHILSSNSLFDAVGIAVDGQKKDYTDVSSNPIFWRKDILELLDWGTFWLSDTPDAVGSYTWNKAKPRTCTWARFRVRCSGKTFYYFNAHVENDGGLEAKEKSILLIMERMQAANPSGVVPMIFGGDMNNVISASAPLGPMAQYLSHAPTYCKKTDTGRTFNGFKTTGGSAIDHLFYSEGAFSGKVFSVDRKAYENVTYLSDHYPIFCELEFI